MGNNRLYAKRLKLQLIHPPDDDLTVEVIAPIGLALIAKAVEHIVDVEIIDGNNESIENVLKMLDGDYIGVTDWFCKHKNALRILEKAKSIGAITLVGGPNATHLADRYLNNQPYVDYVVTGDGEDAMLQLVSNCPLEFIPNLVYRKDGKVVHNRKANVTLNRTFDLENVVNFDPANHPKHHPFPISSIRGCIKESKGERCSFCSIAHTLKIMSAELVWEQIDILHEKYGFTYFFETGDSFLVGKWPERLLQCRPAHLSHIEFRVYASPEEISYENIQVLKKLNAREVFIGVEHTDKAILNRAHKYHTPDEMEELLVMIDEAGIRPLLPFIFGLPGETKETLKKNCEFIESIMTKRPNTHVTIAIPIPLFGTELFNELAAIEEAKTSYNNSGQHRDKNLDTDDSFDYELLIRLSIKHQTEIDYRVLMAYVKIGKQLAGGSGKLAGHLERFKVMANSLNTNTAIRKPLTYAQLNNTNIKRETVRGFGWFYFRQWDMTIMAPTKCGTSSIKQFIWMHKLSDSVSLVRQHEVTGSLFAVVRNPYERFASLWRSKCRDKYLIADKRVHGMSPSQLMDHILAGNRDVHWTPQSTLIGKLAPTLIPLPKLNEWWRDRNYGELGTFNSTDGDTEISEELKSRILTFYADDVMLYNTAVEQYGCKELAIIDI